VDHVQPGHRAGQDDVQPVQAARLGLRDSRRSDGDDMVADFDLMDFLRLLTDRCVGMLDASAATTKAPASRAPSRAWWWAVRRRGSAVSAFRRRA
jgi:hypothetical protein